MSEPTQRMTEMIYGCWVSQVVRGAAHYDLAGHLHRQPLDAEAFAAAEGLEPQAAARFLRACAALGLTRFDGARFHGTELLDLLREDHPRSLRGLARAVPGPGQWRPWGRFTEALRTGERQTVPALGAEYFEYLKTAPEEADAFTQAMTDLTGQVAPEIVQRLDTAGATRVVDVGSAAGALLFPLLNAHPGLMGVVFDLPHVIPGALAAARAAGLADRVEAVGGDFFQGVPEGDLYLLKWILHAWDDAACLAILGHCRRAARPGGRIAIIEFRLGSIGEPGLASLMDLTMLVMMPGRERAIEEYGDLLARAGFGEIQAAPAAECLVVVTGKAPG